jgi:Asp-tRNA(Asn)/Glu-tRNA(Gln) amidotransferase B subunit
MADIFAVTNEVIDPILAEVVKGNQDKVVAWIRGEPGAWGFLSGQAVATIRDHADRSLASGERRLVWSRMWWWLEQVRARIYDKP